MQAPSKFSTLLPPSWKACIQQWLDDDVPTFDVGGFVVGDKEEEAWLLGKSGGVVAGVPFFQAVFEHLGCTVEWLQREGAHPALGDRGMVHALLEFCLTGDDDSLRMLPGLIELLRILQ